MIVKLYNSELLKMLCLRFPITLKYRYVSYVVTIIPFPFHECDLQNKTIYRVCNNMSNTTGATCGAGAAYPFVAPSSIPSF